MWDYVQRLLFGAPTTPFTRPGGLANLGGVDPATDRGYAGGLIIDTSTPGPTRQEEANLWEKLISGDSKDMTRTRSKDMSGFASLAQLLKLANNQTRAKPQRQQTAGYMHPSIQGLLGG